MSDLKEICEEILGLYRRVEWLAKQKETMNEYCKKLEAENRKLKYEYEDSKLNRDKPMPPKWVKHENHASLLCPKCEMFISNWQGYCHACGQKIAKGNLMPENEVKHDE